MTDRQQRWIIVPVLLLSVGLAFPISASAQITLRRIVSGLSQPVAFIQDPTNANVQFIVQKGGRIRVLKNGALQAADFLDLTAQVTNTGERGLLGLAFAPDYATSGRFYVDFTNLSGNTVIARFKRSDADPLKANAATRFDLKWSSGLRYIPQPYENH